METPLKLSHLQMLSSHLYREFLTDYNILAFGHKFCNEEIDVHLVHLAILSISSLTQNGKYKAKIFQCLLLSEGMRIALMKVGEEMCI